MHGLWYQRTWLDLGREAIIHAVLSLLYVPAWQIKCATSMVIITLIGLQHLASLFVHPDGFLPPYIVLPGAALLGTMGYIRGSRLLFFVGLYSVVSKYEFIRLVSHSTRASMGSFADTFNELLKLGVAATVWAVFAFVLPFATLERAVYRLIIRKPLPKRRPQYWFSEIACLCPWLAPPSGQRWHRVRTRGDADGDVGGDDSLQDGEGDPDKEDAGGYGNGGGSSDWFQGTARARGAGNDVEMADQSRPQAAA